KRYCFIMMCSVYLGLTRDFDGHCARIRRAVAELARCIVAPAIGDAAGGVRAVVIAAFAAADEHEPACHRDRHRALLHRTVAELAGVVRAPAIGGAVGRACAGVITAGAHGREIAQATSDCNRHLSVGRRAVTELAGGVRAPAVASTGGGAAAGMIG